MELCTGTGTGTDRNREKCNRYIQDEIVTVAQMIPHIDDRRNTGKHTDLEWKARIQWSKVSWEK